MTNQFSRFELLIGEDNLKLLSTKKVAVFGIGGVGSYVVEALVRSGIGKITIIDNDTINLTNLNRQLYALHSTVGKYKVDVAKERILDINPNIEVETHKIFFSNETKDEIDFKSFDYIIDAIDTVKSKILLAEIATELNIAIISSMGTGNKLDTTKFEISDIFKTSVCPLARVMRTELKKRNIRNLKVVYSKENPIKPIKDSLEQENIKKIIPGSCAFVPSIAGLTIAGEVIKDLIKNA